MAEVQTEKTKWIPLCMAFCIMLGVSLPYLYTVAMDKVNMFLPYISHASAFPPQSAFLCIFVAIGTFFGVLTFIIRYASVDQKRSRLEPKKIKNLNIVSFGCGCVAAVSFLVSSHYPVGYVTHEKKDWVKSVVVPHFICTGILLFANTSYVLIQSYLTYVHRKKSTRNVFFHAFLAMCVVITNWTSCLPFYAAIKEMVPRVVSPESGAVYLETKEYSFYYIISSLSQWAFTFFSILFIATFYRDFKHMKITFRAKQKPITSIRLDSVQTDSPHTTFNGNEEITKM